MFVILTYDVHTKRGPKVLKICRKYLPHVQKSVFEGDITESKLRMLKSELAHVIKCEEDNIIIYEFQSVKYSQKETIGKIELKKNIV